MNAIQQRVLSGMIGATGHIVDLHRNYAALCYARAIGCEPECRQMIVAERMLWLNQQTLWQRKWQSNTRRPSRARHHDSVAIREKYVRCI